MRFSLREMFRWQCAIGMMIIGFRLEHWDALFAILLAFGAPSLIERTWQAKHPLRMLAMRFGLAVIAALFASKEYGIAYVPVYLLCAVSFVGGCFLLCYRGKH